MNPPPPRDAARGRSPSRPSFLAPTKASLARSHPEVLERALSRSPTRRPANRGSQDGRQSQAESRVFGLRDRKALRPSLTSIGSPVDPRKRDIQSPLNRRSSGLSVFAAPPRRVSRRISASDFQFQSPAAARVNKVEPTIINTPDDQLASELGSAADPIGDFDQTSLHDGFEEPDLPPTPTQLGLERPPGRPKGFLSSSPTMQQKSWWKRRATGEVEQSPSKLRNVGHGVNALELTGPGSTADDTLLPEPVRKKRKLKRELSAELESLKKDVAKLENLSAKLDQNDDSAQYYLSDLISILKSDDPTLTSTKRRRADPTISSLISTLLPFSTKRPPKPRDEPDPTNPFVLDQKAQTEPYLSALAPLALTASSNIVPSTKPDSFLERHTLTLSAPRPFPFNSYNISITYETNLETQSLVLLEPHYSADSKVPSYLRQWISSRLWNPLLNLDVSGLCWGINRYWEALVTRAQIWTQVEDQHAELIGGRTNLSASIKQAKPNGSGKGSLEGGSNTLTLSDLQRISPHLERTSMLFESKEKSLRVILTCELTLDEWTSEPELIPGICVSATGETEGISTTKVEQESKKLFQAILSESRDTQPVNGADSRAIMRATECVLSALFGDKVQKEK